VMPPRRAPDHRPRRHIRQWSPATRDASAAG
jgi:hypothetical protein